MKKNNQIIIIVIVLSLLGFILYPWVILPIKNTMVGFLNDVSTFFNHYTLSFSNFFSKIESIKNLTEKNQDITEENIDLKAKIASLEEAKHENEILKKELNFIKNDNTKNLLAAQIISYAPNAYTRSIKLNKGKKDGVAKNQAVVSSGFLVGLVEEVYDDSSDVLFITDTKSFVPVSLQESRGSGLLQGGLKGLFVKEIPLDVRIMENEMVITSSINNEFSAGIPVGNVSKIISKESEIFQKVEINSPIDFSSLEIVFIVK